MARRHTPEVGGGGPAIAGGAVGSSGQANLAITDETIANGRYVLSEVERHVRALPSPTAVRELARLVKDFHHIVLRSPTFAEGIEFLRARGNDAAIARLYGEARRGRKMAALFYELMLVEKVMEQEGCTVAAAARKVSKDYLKDFMKEARSIENDYARHRAYYRAWRSNFVDESELTREFVKRPTR